MDLITTRVKFFFQGKNLSTSIDQSTQQRIFISKSQRLATHSKQGDTSLLATDLQGSSIVEQHRTHPHINSYTPYGNSPSVDGASTLVKYNGERSDPHSGLYFLGQGRRCFSAALMRFYSPDSLSPFDAGGLNSYTYCLGDPVNYSDPSGLTSFPHLFSKLNRHITRIFSSEGKKLHHAAQNPRPSGVIDIPKREKQFKDKLNNASVEKLEKLKPKIDILDADLHNPVIITEENYGNDSYNALYQESKEFKIYGDVMHDRGMSDQETLSDWRVAGYNLDNFEIVEARLLAKIIRKHKKNRWARPSVQRAFDSK